MAYAFKSPSEWKSALLSLGDAFFFDLIRTYLGDIRTPFNKQRLVDDLEALLSRREIQTTVADYLDETDGKVIAAIVNLGEPTSGELASFFEGEYSFAELHAVLLNLEERLVVYRFVDSVGHHLALNPVFEAPLAPLVGNAASLFPSCALGEPSGDDTPPALNDPVLAALLFFFYGRIDVHKIDGSYKKKAMDEVDRVFPGLEPTAILGAFRGLGLLHAEDQGFRLDEDRIAAFAALSGFERLAYLSAAIVAWRLDPDKGKRHLPRDRLHVWARLIHAFLRSLDPDRAYPDLTLHRLLDVLEREQGPARRRWDAVKTDPGTELRAGIDAAGFRRALLETLELAGLLVGCGDERRRLRRSDAARPDAAARSGAGPVLVFDGPFSCLVYPEIPFADALALARFCEVREVGRTVRLELNRESAVQGFDLALDTDAMLALLDRLSGGRVEQTLRWSLKEWRDRYAGVALHRGLVLTVAEDRRYLAEADGVKELIVRTLAPGVYLLSVPDEAAAVAVLRKAGVDIIALPPLPPVPRGRTTEGRPAAFPALEIAAAGRRGHPAIPPAAAREALPETAAAGVPAALARLRTCLDQKNLPKDQKDELSARIERRLVLTETQLVGAAVRYEKLEAKGLDYVGKVRVAEQALAASSLVEIFWRGTKGEPNRALGTPIALDKSGGEVMLVVESAPAGERISVAIGKISLLRRIKRSIFGE